MAYTPDPTDVAQPVDSVFASTAAAEFRALKAYIQTIVSGGGLGVATPGQIALFPGDTPLAGWLELNGSLQLRATFPSLWANVQALGNIVTEAQWSGGRIGAFSSGDLATNFRLPDLRGVFVRGFNHGKAGTSTDPGRVNGALQSATGVLDNGGSAGTIIVPATSNAVINEDEIYTNPASYQFLGGAAGGTDPLFFNSVRPINIPLMYCVKT